MDEVRTKLGMGWRLVWLRAERKLESEAGAEGRWESFKVRSVSRGRVVGQGDENAGSGPALPAPSSLA